MDQIIKVAAGPQPTRDMGLINVEGRPCFRVKPPSTSVNINIKIHLGHLKCLEGPVKGLPINKEVIIE